MASRQDEIGTPEGIRTPGLLLRRQLLYPTELLAHSGAGDENRTRIPSLEGWCPGHCATPAYGPTVRACRSPAANYQLAYHSTPLPVCQYLFYKIFSPSIFSRKTLAFFLKVRYYRKKTQNCAARILCLRRQHGAAVLLPSILFPFRNRDTYFLI